MPCNSSRSTQPAAKVERIEMHWNLVKESSCYSGSNLARKCWMLLLNVAEQFDMPSCDINMQYTWTVYWELQALHSWSILNNSDLWPRDSALKGTRKQISPAWNMAHTLECNFLCQSWAKGGKLSAVNMKNVLHSMRTVHCKLAFNIVHLIRAALES